MNNANVVICGAGIAGISAAYFLAVREGIRDILLVDERDPLSLTSDKSTECYRNWWPGPGSAMVALMNRSIDLLEELAAESRNTFHLNRRGYLYMTADPDQAIRISRDAQAPPRLGAGELRIHEKHDHSYLPSPLEGYLNLPDGADLFLNPRLIRKHFPYLSETVIAALHVRRAGWFSAQQLGMYLLDQARLAGVKRIQARVQQVQVQSGRVRSVLLDNGDAIQTQCFVNAGGPFLKPVGRMLGVDLPVYSELHLKAAFKDTLAVVPRQAPLLIWTDPQVLEWSDEERELLADIPEFHYLLEQMPSGAHTRPEGAADADIAIMLWEYHTEVIEPVFPPPMDDQYPEIALRGLAPMLPGLRKYFGRMPRPRLDGGYYTRTQENRPLIGPLPVEGAYVIGALSGFGLMVACGAGELLAAHLAGKPLPEYAPAFSLQRYQDPDYLRLLENWGDTGQL
jgi:glycine/D-amino acid oxidase-like deaminating enzyme